MQGRDDGPAKGGGTAQNLMVWLTERRGVREEHAEQVRKELADTAAEAARS
ncbi:hypothetical protein SAMN05216533_1471 [Streptomyces sp. Ag109_O5-10]|nr:hypothetical protein SAMN05216533_1471 [Streptomyces sp. Ag109_O5-10]